MTAQNFFFAAPSAGLRMRGLQPKQRKISTGRLAIMNLALCGIEADLGKEHADTFRRDPQVAKRLTPRSTDWKN